MCICVCVRACVRVCDGCLVHPSLGLLHVAYFRSFCEEGQVVRYGCVKRGSLTKQYVWVHVIWESYFCVLVQHSSTLYIWRLVAVTCDITLYLAVYQAAIEFRTYCSGLHMQAYASWTALTAARQACTSVNLTLVWSVWKSHQNWQCHIKLVLCIKAPLHHCLESFSFPSLPIFWVTDFQYGLLLVGLSVCLSGCVYAHMTPKLLLFLLLPRSLSSQHRKVRIRPTKNPALTPEFLNRRTIRFLLSSPWKTLLHWVKPEDDPKDAPAALKLLYPSDWTACSFSFLTAC